MSNDPTPDHWRTLASELGAEVPEKDAADQPTSDDQPMAGEQPVAPEPPPEPKETPRSTERPARPERPRADWTGLAEQLGVVPTEPPSVAPPEPPQEPDVIMAMSALPSITTDPPDWLERESLVDPKEEDISPESPPQPCEADDTLPPTETAEQKLPRKRKKRRRRSRESSTPAELSDTEKKGEEPESIVADATVDLPAEETVPEDKPDESAKPVSKRRRRGRKKSKDRKKSTDEASEIASDETALASKSGEDRSNEQGKKPRASKEEQDNKPARKTAKSHRGIPSWDEAVGVVIEANLGTRTKKSDDETSPKPRGGRGRGGKNKTGSKRSKSK